jgi:carbohydrate-binding DOMON domain-containing protein
MIDKLKSLFTAPNQKEKTMTATANQTQTQTQTQTQQSKTCAFQGVEQLSATSTCCEGNTICQESVRERAYLLWEQAGSPEGDGVDFWVAAEQEFSN